MKRVIFYFDGFNFYNGLRDRSVEIRNWKNYYWIDIVKFCDLFFKENGGVTEVKYFTSPPMNQHKKAKQSALFKANEILNPNRFKVINGQYHNVEMTCERDCKKKFTRLEEKRTDVCIGVTMLLDCFHNNVDTLVLVSADSDQIPTIKAIKTHFPSKTLKVYFPPNRISNEILAISRPVVLLKEHEEKFKQSIMPTEVFTSDRAKKYTKPADWNP